MIWLKAWVMVIVLTVVAAAPASADQIDGNWCHGLLHLSIDGPSIVTPGGIKMTGVYDRHGFQYVVPDGEPDAGATITMVQRHDALMQLTSSLTPDTVQDWSPCNRQIS